MDLLLNKKFMMAFLTLTIFMLFSLMMSNCGDVLGLVFLVMFGVFGFLDCLLLGVVVCRIWNELMDDENKAE